MNKKGLATVNMFLYVFGVFFGIVFLGIIVFIFTQVTTVLRTDIDVGQVNLKNVTDDSLGKITDGLADNADNLGIMLILGMALMMIMNGYYFGSRNNKIWLVIDFFILIFVFILAVYMSQTYETLINSTTLLSEIFIDTIPKASKFVLNLPSIVATLGALIMIFSYAGINRDEEAPNVLNF